MVHQGTGVSQGGVWATHQQQDYCHNRIIAQYTWGPGRARVESGQHTNNGIIATTGLLHSTHGDRGETGWSLGNTPTTGLLPQQDYCMVHQGTWRARVESGQHTDNRIIATAGLLHSTPGHRGEPGWSLGNTPTTGLLPQQDYCTVRLGTGASQGGVWETHQQQDYCHDRIIAWYTRRPGRARVESGQHTDNRIIATTGLLHGTLGTGRS